MRVTAQRIAHQVDPRRRISQYQIGDDIISAPCFAGSQFVVAAGGKSPAGNHLVGVIDVAVARNDLAARRKVGTANARPVDIDGGIRPAHTCFDICLGEGVGAGTIPEHEYAHRGRAQGAVYFFLVADLVPAEAIQMLPSVR